MACLWQDDDKYLRDDIEAFVHSVSLLDCVNLFITYRETEKMIHDLECRDNEKITQ